MRENQQYSGDPYVRLLQMLAKFEQETQPPKWLSLLCIFIGIVGIALTIWRVIT